MVRLILVKETQVGADTFDKRMKTLDVALPELERLLANNYNGGWSFVGVEVRQPCPGETEPTP